MIVRGEPVMMLGVIVIDVRVDVQRRHLAGGHRQHASEQDRERPTHDRECMEREDRGQTRVRRDSCHLGSTGRQGGLPVDVAAEERAGARDFAGSTGLVQSRLG